MNISFRAAKCARVNQGCQIILVGGRQGGRSQGERLREAGEERAGGESLQGAGSERPH